MRQAPKSYQKMKPIHPTVAAEFEVRNAGIPGDPLPFVWVRGAAVGAGSATLAECEKDALRHLRSLPVRP